MDREQFYGTIGFVAGLTLGSVVTWYVTKRYLSKTIDETIDAEIERLKEHYDKKARLNKTGPYEKLSDLAKKYHESLAEMGYASVDEAENDPGFDKNALIAELKGDTDEDEDDLEFENPEEDLREFYAMRNTEEPYIITYEEFADEHFEYGKESVYYFEDDDVVCDAHDELFDDVLAALGEEWKDNFGLYSHDENIVYVRNERIAMDFEICIKTGTYADAIGYVEPKPKKQTPKMRRSDND